METTRSDNLMTAKELADHLGVKPGTTLGWHHQAKLPARELLSHKVLRFNLRDVVAALECSETARRERGDG
jgi:hypothetical protein